MTTRRPATAPPDASFAGEIETIFYRHDPMKLVDGDTPPDEYRPEAEVVAAALAAMQDEVTAQALRQLVHATFARFFAPASLGDPALYDSAADEIHHAWQQSAAAARSGARDKRHSGLPIDPDRHP